MIEIGSCLKTDRWSIFVYLPSWIHHSLACDVIVLSLREEKLSSLSIKSIHGQLYTYVLSIRLTVFVLFTSLFFLWWVNSLHALNFFLSSCMCFFYHESISIRMFQIISSRRVSSSCKQLYHFSYLITIIFHLILPTWVLRIGSVICLFTCIINRYFV